MADHVVAQLNPGRDPRQPVSEGERETRDAIARVLIERCTADRWSAEARRCFLAITSLADSDRCAPLLTEAQKAAADRAMAELFQPGKSTK